ncbi:hypothetical protein BDF20DRAFT_832097 [Mycotypha africana]|uniref:uncharacterized protein n=1 Tax=Mycotypha africana TaxID=64632 RepID=UPI002300207B|nr:uncharacterized protein BDF20DRAFT_832097 [Mycotypha africana]KAI8992115.1 hypothetical protein BDF20DRAFT_832097 [Mycotypha africana]
MSKRQTRARPIESSTDGGDSTSRQRQMKRDEAIRKKLEQDFSKKRSTASRTLGKNRRIPGTVSALRVGQALTVKETMRVMEATQLMAAKRCDCVLVINDNDQLSGIFTAKDIAYRLVAENLDAKRTPVIDIMTKNPMCVTSDTSATEALNLMVSKGFRHLPVCNEEGDIFGLLDITKCLYSALEKMERAFGSSRELYDAMENVEKEWAGTSVQMNQYMESLRQHMSCPNLESVLDGTPPAEVKYKTNVRDIAVMMKELHTTAVLVTKHHNLAGIFTSKDIVLRVIAAGLNPENCTVVRVMTPSPDTAAPSTTVLDALKLMNEGHYLNLPILEKGIVIGMVDVLKLTYVTLEQMRSMEGQEGEGGPLWGKFWDSFGTLDHLENTSQLSDNSSAAARPRSLSLISDPMLSPQPSTSLSHLKSFSDISPNESASMVNQPSSAGESHTSSGQHLQPLQQQQMDTFTFKFTSARQKTHRVVCRPYFSELSEAVRTKLLPEHGDDDVGSDEWLTLFYIDDEDDQILITCDEDVSDAVRLAVKTGQNRVKLIAQDKSLVPTISISSQNDNDLPRKVEAAVVEAPDVLKEEKETMRSDKKSANTTLTSTRRNSKELRAISKGKRQSPFLPASIGLLGAVIVGVVVFTKVFKKSPVDIKL